MGIEPCTRDCPENRAKRVKSLCKEIKSTREKMERETRTFIEASKNFSLEWVQREMNSNISKLKNEDYSENLETGKDMLSKLSRLEGLPFRIQEIVEEHLNRDDCWPHRNELLHTDISRDYIEFKKEKTRKDLTSSIRMVLGCAAEVFADFKDKSPEDKLWVRERGKRKYICILRFSDEMTASLDQYFSMLEELFVLEYEMNNELKKEVYDGKDKNNP
ncbi:MAG: hypothetical protein QM426_02390 [Euryarchaeota archaeon]|nr:hypothetical protein [Euryarchaeota archaeon]